jgi:exosortase
MPEKLIPSNNVSRVVGMLLGLTVLWVYWPTLATMAKRWSQDPEYSHGYLVPVFALFLLWHNRHRGAGAWKWSKLWGLGLVAAAIALRLTGAHFYFNYLEELSLLPCLFGACLVLGGTNLLSRCWPAIAYLFFMLPLPYYLEVSLAGPLQGLATTLSTVSLQLLGFPATSEGNVIFVGDIRIGVIQACGGLSMLLTFFAVTVAVAIVIRRPLADKAALVASAIPIALFANVARITITAILYDQVGERTGSIFFHDVAGWFMMILALGMLWVEAWLLSHLLLEPESEEDEIRWFRKSPALRAP